jgi:uncharacterized protein
MRFRRNSAQILVLCLLSGVFSSANPGHCEKPQGYLDRKRVANESVVTIMGSGTASPYTLFAEDIQNVVDEPDTPGGLRVLPILGRGGAHSAADVLLVKDVDMGIFEQDDVSAAAQKDPVTFQNWKQQLRYVTKLSNSEFQVLARKDVRNLEDLQGKKVNCFKVLSSTQLACDKIFGSLLKINIVQLNLDQEEANAKLKSGEIDAIVRYAGAPHGAFKGFKKDDNLHFVPVDADSLGPEKYADLLKGYSPALLKTEYYPALIQADQPVPTIAGSTLLAVYNWAPGSERYNRCAKFVNSFFANIARFQGPGRQPKWKEINIAYDVPGWTRFKAAQDWLDARKQAESAAPSKLRNDFDSFLEARHVSNEGMPKEQRDTLFAQFMSWYSQKNR